MLTDTTREEIARAISIADHKRVADGLADGWPEDISDWDVAMLQGIEPIITRLIADARADERQAAEADTVAKWLPIESAPMNGPHIMAWCRFADGSEALLSDVYRSGDSWISVWDGLVAPIAWQPLPAPPTQGAWK